MDIKKNATRRMRMIDLGLQLKNSKPALVKDLIRIVSWEHIAHLDPSSGQNVAFKYLNSNIMTTRKSYFFANGVFMAEVVVKCLDKLGRIVIPKKWREKISKETKLFF